MLSLEEALQKLLGAIGPVGGEESAPVAEAIGRFLAEDVVALSALPAFDNSAMDGWAVRSVDVQKATAERPVALECIGNVPAGEIFEGTVGPGQCARIFTGSPLPAGADAVVMQEDTRAELPKALVLEGVKPWENIRFRGEDVKQGSVVARGGARVNAQMAALFSACGIAGVKVGQVLRVAILATGNELKTPGSALKGGEIFESNRILVSTLVRQLGMEAIVKPIVADELL